MKKILIVSCFMLSVGFFAFNASAATKGFDKFGYNYSARIFNGSADGIDKNLDGAVWNDTFYAKDKVTMKWNADWDRGKIENWSNPPYAAWEDNEWNGKVEGGSGEVWHYKIKWVGDCEINKALLVDGGYCVWGQFETLMDQGTSGNVHSWLAHAIATGYSK